MKERVARNRRRGGRGRRPHRDPRQRRGERGTPSRSSCATVRSKRAVHFVSFVHGDLNAAKSSSMAAEHLGHRLLPHLRAPATSSGLSQAGERSPLYPHIGGERHHRARRGGAGDHARAARSPGSRRTAPRRDTGREECAVPARVGNPAQSRSRNRRAAVPFRSRSAAAAHRAAALRRPHALVRRIESAAEEVGAGLGLRAGRGRDRHGQAQPQAAHRLDRHAAPPLARARSLRHDPPAGTQGSRSLAGRGSRHTEVRGGDAHGLAGHERGARVGPASCLCVRRRRSAASR